jgi:uncharacterized protein (DUF952 family)
MTYVYKIVSRLEWDAAVSAGVFEGAAIDLQDGYIHLSTAAQAAETARRYFVGQEELVLVRLDVARLGPALKWEPSRGGDLFPHVYGPLDPKLAEAVTPIQLAADGTPQLGELPA